MLYTYVVFVVQNVSGTSLLTGDYAAQWVQGVVIFLNQMRTHLLKLLDGTPYPRVQQVTQSGCLPGNSKLFEVCGCRVNAA